MKHLNISDDAMKIILENSAWADFGIKVTKAEDAKLDEATEQIEEEADEHVCPLCQSHLDEAISDEALMEHTANVLEAVNAATLNEEVDEDADEDEDDDEGEELLEEEEKEEEEEPEETEEAALKAKHGDRVGAAMYARGAKNIKKPAGKKK